MTSPYAQYVDAVFRNQKYSGHGWTSYPFGSYLFQIPNYEGMLDDIAKTMRAARDGVDAEGNARFSRRISKPAIIEDALSKVMPPRKK